MYSREQKDFKNSIPDNYGGITMKAEPPRAHHDRCDDACPPCNDRGDNTQPCNEGRFPPPHDDNCRRDTDCNAGACQVPQNHPPERKGGILSSLFGRLGLDGIDSTELIILVAALLLMNGDGDDDNYIWIVLLLLLITK